MKRKCVVVELWDACEVVTYLPHDATDPSQDELNALATDYAMTTDWQGDGTGVATCRVVEDIVMFPEPPLTFAQQQALAGCGG